MQTHDFTHDGKAQLVTSFRGELIVETDADYTGFATVEFQDVPAEKVVGQVEFRAWLEAQRCKMAEPTAGHDKPTRTSREAACNEMAREIVEDLKPHRFVLRLHWVSPVGQVTEASYDDRAAQAPAIMPGMMMPPGMIPPGARRR